LIFYFACFFQLIFRSTFAGTPNPGGAVERSRRDIITARGPALSATPPTAAPPGLASAAFCLVARPRRSFGYASGLLCRKL